MPKKYALLIGINKYLYMEEQYQLRGCENDAKLMKNVLINKFNFDPANIKSLYSENATREAIIGQMESLAQTIQKDDILVFHYSGHGHQCRVKEGFSSEGSGKDNCILPTDDSEPDGENLIWREIRDKEFNAWLQRIAEKTRFTTLIFDACHSGTMTRDAADTARSRSIPTDIRDLNRRSAASPNIAALKRSPSSAGVSEKTGAGGWLTLSENYTVISGCRDTQTSKEWEFTIDGGGVRHGVMTYFLTRALLNAKPGNTYRDVFEQVSSGVVSEVSEQNPQIEGAIDRELFGVTDIEPFAHIRITNVQGSIATLDAGLAHGIQAGSKWDIYPPESKTSRAEARLGTLKIEKVSGLSCEAQLLENQVKVVAGARCIEVESVTAEQLLRVDLSHVPTNYRSDLEPLIEQSKVLTFAHNAQVVARIIDIQSDLPQGFNEEPQVSLPVWALFEQQDQLCMPLHATTEPNVTQLLLNNLEKIAKFKRVMQLNNVKSELNVAFNVYKQLSDGSLEIANGGTTQFDPSESMVLEIINNDANKTLFFTILWISANKEIAHFYPPRKACELINPQTTVHIGKGRNLLRVALSSDFPHELGTETCKVIFATEESDFSWLHQQGVRAGDELQDEDWFAINRSFILETTTI